MTLESCAVCKGTGANPTANFQVRSTRPGEKLLVLDTKCPACGGSGRVPPKIS